MIIKIIGDTLATSFNIVKHRLDLIGCAEECVHEGMGHCHVPIPDLGKDILHGMAESLHALEIHGCRHSFEGMRRAEDFSDCFFRRSTLKNQEVFHDILVVFP
ncbi:MAG: hypothetical protein A4E42_01129 [Methanoregulaceae archaeon PtaU1.Bin222]|nr:MAG: hypothetical protein A4E42_01129 [Methanoregulaceae archaeon PtaU1.Bin222]